MTETAGRVHGHWVLRVLEWTAYATAAAAVAIPLHEAGHWLAALAVGTPEPVLHYSSISHGDIGGMAPWTVAVTGAAGPAVTAALTLGGCWWAARGGGRWAYALGIAASSRFYVGLPYVVGSILTAIAGLRRSPAELDEFKAAAAVGLPGTPFVAATVVLGIGAWIFLGRRLPRGERASAWTGLLLGTVLGWIAWLGVLGPLLLP